MTGLLALIPLLFSADAAQERAELRPLRREAVVNFRRNDSWKAMWGDEGVELDARKRLVTIPPRKQAAVGIWNSDGSDFSAFDELRLEVNSESDELITTRWRLRDANAKASAEFVLDPGPNLIIIPLRDLFADDLSRPLDTKALKNLTLSFGRMGKPFVFQPVRLEVWTVNRGDERIRVFDFGPKGECWPGAVPVWFDLAYTDERGYGVTTSELQTKVLRSEFALFGDGVAGREVGFSVNLPDGEYEVRTVAYHLAWDNVRDNANYSIEAEGQEVVRTEWTLADFLTFEHHYYGADVFFDPRKPIVEQYFGKYYEPHKFSVNVADGRLDLTFRNCTVFAVMLWPKTLVAEGALAALYKEQYYDVWKKHLRYQPYKQEKEPYRPTREDRAQGFVVFTRGTQVRVLPEQEPEWNEVINSLVVSCAPGGAEKVCFIVRPLRDLGNLEYVQAGFKDPRETPMPPPEVFVVKDHLQRVSGPFHQAVPTLLVPAKAPEALEGWNQQYWLNVQIPEDTQPGRIAGTLRIKYQRSEPKELLLDINVLPFKLEPANISFGMWNNGASGAHQLNSFGGDPEIQDNLVDAEIADHAAHGMTGYALPRLYPAKLNPDNTVQLDCSFNDLVAGKLRNYAMNKQVSIIDVIGAANYRLMRWGLKEFSPEFNTAYKDLLRQIVDWSKRADVNAVIFLVDEPREVRIQDWNRNRVDCIKYLRLAHEVPGARTTISLMGDEDYFGDQYTPMVPLMDVVMAHEWEKSRQIMLLTIKEKISSFIGYNNGWSRYVWGFHQWKLGSDGNWQWVYNWENSHGWLPLFNSGEASAAFAYPGGYAPTIKYEWVREGITDYRYLLTLEKAVRDNPGAEAAQSARQFLDTLQKFLPQYPQHGLRSGEEAGAMTPGELSGVCPAWRNQTTEFIVAINEGRAAELLPQASAMFPKALEAFEKSYTARIVIAPPVIDGKLDDAAWQDLGIASGFVSIPRAEKASVETEVKIVSDGKYAYFAFHCIEPLYGEMKAYAIDRDKDVWQDDSVEMFLDTNLDQASYYHIIVNTLGTVQDADTRDGLWNGDVKAAVQKGKGFYDVEVAVNLESMKAKVEPGATWGMNLCRNRFPSKAESSSWAFVGTGFHNPDKFGKLTFGK